MQITGSFQFEGSGLSITPVPTPTGVISGDVNLSLGTQVAWTSNTYFYTANSSTVRGSDFVYDTNNMVWQVFYAHKQIRLFTGANRWGPIPRSSGSNTIALYQASSTATNTKSSFNSNVDVALSAAISASYSANTLYQAATQTAVTIPAKRYFLLGITGGPFYRSFLRTANNITAVFGGEAVVTALNEVYVGPWPSGPGRGIPTLLGGNTASYVRYTSNIYYSAFKFEIV
jgi:hypothetical protein